jgi:site-specific recombinase XerD
VTAKVSVCRNTPRFTPWIYTLAQRTLTGDVQAARLLLEWQADYRKWTPETARARWDGTARFLAWWCTLPAHVQPPLERLTRDDAQAFIEHLKAEGLAFSTIKNYREGARAFLKIVFATKQRPSNFKHTYDPFRGTVLPKATKQRPEVSPAAIARYGKHRTQARLELLVALLELGMTVPEICSRTWVDVDLEQRRLYGYRQRIISLNRRAYAAVL